MTVQSTETLKVGDLARRTGLSVRTLHHYDEIGLLRPAGRTSSGHRLYGAEEVGRLQQIASLRRIGLSLGDIARCLEQGVYSFEHTVSLHIRRIREEMAEQARLCALLERLKERVAADQPPSISDLTQAIELSLRVDQYYTPEQLTALEERGKRVGPERMRSAQDEWTELFADFGRAMDEGAEPTDVEVLALARKAKLLVEEFTGDDAGVRASLGRLYETEGAPKMMQAHGIELPEGLWEYMSTAGAALEAAGD